MNKTVFITGATSGFGLAIARALAKHPYHLILTGRNGDILNKICEELRAVSSCSITPLVFDIQDYNACEKAINSLPDSLKAVDVLINNAGLAVELNPLHQGALEDWERMINTNLKGLLYVTRLLSPAMVNRRSGQIINIGSTSSYETYEGGNVYCATKHAVLALTKSMRTDFLPYNIKVTQISPGAAETNFSVVRFHGDQAKADQVYDGYDPLTAQDIADVVEFVLSRPPHVCLNEIVLTCTSQYNGKILKNI
jgi:NADP-dependent 3-hydroxy acid dehydrogenase YdfG